MKPARYVIPVCFRTDKQGKKDLSKGAKRRKLGEGEYIRHLIKSDNSK